MSLWKKIFIGTLLFSSLAINSTAEQNYKDVDSGSASAEEYDDNGDSSVEEVKLKVKIGCKSNPYQYPAYLCIESVKLNGKFLNITSKDKIEFEVTEPFKLEVRGAKAKGYVAYVKINDASGEVYYEEKDANYARFRVH